MVPVVAGIPNAEEGRKGLGALLAAAVMAPEPLVMKPRVVDHPNGPSMVPQRPARRVGRRVGRFRVGARRVGRVGLLRALLRVGLLVGLLLVGRRVGRRVGCRVGARVGDRVGVLVGDRAPTTAPVTCWRGTPPVRRGPTCTGGRLSIRL